MQTACRDCVFARYTDKTQTGCTLGRLDRFEEQGVLIEATDNETDFYLIDRICLTHRHKDSPWAKRFKPEEYAKQANLEIRLRMDLYVPILGSTSLDDLKVTIDSIEQQHMKPVMVQFIVNADGVKPSAIMSLLRSTHFESNVMLLVERLANGKRVGRNRCIDHAAQRSEAGFYGVFDPGVTIPADFVSSIDAALNDADRLERFSLLEPNEHAQGQVVQLALHKHVDGNKPMSLTEFDPPDEEAGVLTVTDFWNGRLECLADKVHYLARKEKKEWLIKPVTEICPSCQW